MGIICLPIHETTKKMKAVTFATDHRDHFVNITDPSSSSGQG